MLGLHQLGDIVQDTQDGQVRHPKLPLAGSVDHAQDRVDVSKLVEEALLAERRLAERRLCPAVAFLPWILLLSSLLSLHHRSLFRLHHCAPQHCFLLEMAKAARFDVDTLFPTSLTAHALLQPGRY